jgi:hypothetical protein
MALSRHMFVAIIIVIATLNFSSEAFLSSSKMSTTAIMQCTSAAAAAWPDNPGAQQLARQQLINGVMLDAAAELRNSNNNYKEVLIDMGRWVESELRSTRSTAAASIEPDKPLQPAAAAALPPPAAVNAITAPSTPAQRPAAPITAQPALQKSAYIQPAYAQPVQRQSVGVDLAAWQRSTQSTASEQQPAVFVGYSLVDDHTDWHSLRQGCDEMLMAAQRRVVSQQRGQQAGAAEYSTARSSSYSTSSYSGSSYYADSFSSVSPVSTGSSATANYRPPAVALSYTPVTQTGSISSSRDSGSLFREVVGHTAAAAKPASYSRRDSSALLFTKASSTAARPGQSLPAMFTAAAAAADDTAVPNSSTQSESIMLKRMQRTVPKKRAAAAAREAPWEREFREQGSAVLQRMRRSGSSSDHSSSNYLGSTSSSSSSSSSGYERAVERPMWGYSDSTEAAPVRRSSSSSSSSSARMGSSVGRGAFSLAALRSAEPDARRWQ